MIMNTHMRNICITLSIIALVGIAGCFVFWSIIRNSIDNIYAAEVALAQQSLVHEQEQTLKSVFETVADDLTKIRGRIIESKGTATFISSLESYAKSIGATLLIDSVAEKTADSEGADFQYLDLTLSTQGSWSEVYRLLMMMESLPYKIKIHSVTLTQGSFTTSGGEGSSPSTVNVWKGTFIMSVLKRK